MKQWMVFLALWAPFLGWADARFVEAPAECHIPYDNANVENEYKLQSCTGFLDSRNGGTVYDAGLYVELKGVSGNRFIIDGQDVRDAELFPGGVLTVSTSAAESGTACNIVDANGNTYAAPSWQGVTRVKRTGSIYQVDVVFELNCTGGTLQ